MPMEMVILMTTDQKLAEEYFEFVAECTCDQPELGSCWWHLETKDKTERAFLAGRASMHEEVRELVDKAEYAIGCYERCLDFGTAKVEYPAHSTIIELKKYVDALKPFAEDGNV